MEMKPPGNAYTPKHQSKRNCENDHHRKMGFEENFSPNVDAAEESEGDKKKREIKEGSRIGKVGSEGMEDLHRNADALVGSAAAATR